MHKRSTWLISCGLLALSVGAQAQELENATCSGGALGWLWDAFFPNTSNDSTVQPLPASRTFVPEAQRNRATEKRIVMFGDLLPMQKDTPPRVDLTLRSLFASADLVLGNLEAPIDYNGGSLDLTVDQTFGFRSTTAFVKSAMSQYCIDPNKAIFSVANNHAGDQGRFPTTVSSVPQLGVRAIVGIDQSSASAPAIQVTQLGSLKVGVVAWTHVQNSAPTAPLPSWEISNNAAHHDFSATKQQQGIGLLIGMPHWDCQFHLFPKQASVDTARRLHDHGFDLIAGSHPTVPQPVARMDASAQDDDLVFHSLGSVNANYTLNGSRQLVTVSELIVDQTGRTVAYTVHPFVARSADTSLPAVNVCPGGRWVWDTWRKTSWEIVPLSALASDEPNNHARLLRMFETVYPQ